MKSSAPTILREIVARKRVQVAERQAHTSVSTLQRRLAGADGGRGFVAAIRERLRAGRCAVIAEAKRASPSRGVLREHFDAAEIARSYAGAGACCMSVLTDSDFFLGSDEDLQQARSACALPLLRKDFLVDSYQLLEARLLGADCVLLIVACLEDSQLAELYATALELGLEVLIEVHDRAELERSLPLGNELVGINNRDLHSFETRLETTWELLPRVPDDRLVVTESGIHSQQDVRAMRAHGVGGFLVGEAFMRAPDPGARLAELFAGQGL